MIIFKLEDCPFYDEGDSGWGSHCNLTDRNCQDLKMKDCPVNLNLNFYVDTKLMKFRITQEDGYEPDEVKMEELIRLTNSRVRELETHLADSANREQSLMLQLGERDKHLTEAEAMIGNERCRRKDCDFNYIGKVCRLENPDIHRLTNACKSWKSNFSPKLYDS